MKLFAPPAALAAVLVFAPLAKAAPIITGGVYEETKDKDCSAEDLCVIGFTKVPTGKILTISRVSCAVAKATSQLRFSLALGQLGPLGVNQVVERPQFLTPVHLGTGSGLDVYQSNDAVQLVLKNGERPGVSLDAFDLTGNISVQCTILGRRKNS